MHGKHGEDDDHGDEDDHHQGPEDHVTPAPTAAPVMGVIAIGLRLDRGGRQDGRGDREGAAGSRLHPLLLNALGLIGRAVATPSV